MTTKPPPLEPLEAQGTWDDPVVDFTSFKLRAGKTPFRAEAERCKHRSLIYSHSERRITCADCESPVEAFDAFTQLVNHLEAMVREIRQEQSKARAGAEAVLIRRAAKEIDRTWGHKMAPSCPHCRGGLLPQDFADGRSSAYGMDYEIARRKRAIEDGGASGE